MLTRVKLIKLLQICKRTKIIKVNILNLLDYIKKLMQHLDPSIHSVKHTSSKNVKYGRQNLFYFSPQTFVTVSTNEHQSSMTTKKKCKDSFF